jgi:hypothetical protein
MKMDTPTTGDETGRMSSQQASSYGTSGKEYKLWIDYIYDWFGATLERPIRRYVVSLGIGAVLFGLNLGIAYFFGFADLYLTSPGVYIVLLGVVWVTNALRWLSQTYHVRTNMLRPCFRVTDMEYNEIVAPYAKRATNNVAIVAISFFLAILFSGYVGLIYLAPNEVQQIALVAFPPTLPPAWHAGDQLLPKFMCLCSAAIVASIAIVSGAYIMFQTLPLYSRLAMLPVIPLPNVVVELWSGVLDLYQTGALMWSFGIVLAELTYGVHVDILALAFVIAVSAFGLLAFLQPRRALGRLFRRAKSETIERALRRAQTADSSEQSIQDLTELDSFVRFALVNPRTALDPGQLLSIVGSQLVPLIPFAIRIASNWIKLS